MKPLLFLLLTFFIIQNPNLIHAQSAKLFSITSSELLTGRSASVVVDTNGDRENTETTPESSTLLETLPKIFNTIQGEDNVVSTPQVNLLLNKTRQFNKTKKIKKGAEEIEKESQKGIFFSGQFFTSATKFDTSAIFNGVNFLIPKVSRYAFSAGLALASKGEGENTVMGSLEMYLLGKEIPKKNENDELIGSASFASFHSTLNLEILFKDIFSVYGSLHLAKPLTNQNDYLAFFDLQKANFRAFTEIGLITEFVLDNAGAEKKNLLVLKVGFIPKNGAIKTFIDNANSVNDGVPILEFKYNRRFNLD